MRHARQGRDFLGGSLGIAAGQNDFALRVPPPDSPDGSPGVLFGGGRDRTRIQNDKLGLLGSFSSGQPPIPKLLLNSSAVGLSGPTAEIFYVKAGHAPILAYIHLRCGDAGDAPQICKKLRFE